MTGELLVFNLLPANSQVSLAVYSRQSDTLGECGLPCAHLIIAAHFVLFLRVEFLRLASTEKLF